MMKLSKVFNKKVVTQVIGVSIGIIAIYFSLKNINGAELKNSLKSISGYWLIPIFFVNFIVILFKAMRWQITLKLVKPVKLWTMFRILTIGFMANNVLPARLGEALRIHLLGKNALISKITTTGSMVSDKLIEAFSFLILAALLFFISDVPKWLHSGLIIILCITFAAYIAAIIYLRQPVKNKHLKNFQAGITGLMNRKIIFWGLVTSFASWFCQCLIIYMTQQAFGISIPVWGILLVLLVVNLAIAIPGAPSHIGTFEFACILAYTYLGLDKSTALLLGVTYHLVQIIPITFVGGIMLMLSDFSLRKKATSLGHDGPC